MTATQNLVGVSADIIPRDEWIGSYFWYSIPQQSIALSRLKRALKDAGLDPDQLPSERRGEHVMMDACRSVEKIENNGHREEIHADQVMRDENFVIYQITRHVQDKANRVIEHPKALRVLYDFQTGTLSYEALEGAKLTDPDIAKLREAIQDFFDKNGTRVSGHNFRTILRHYVEAAGAENMRGQSGGVYFLASQNKLTPRNRLHAFHGDTIDGHEFLASVKSALEAIYGRAPEWHRIPVINDEEQREFLRRKFVENCSEDCQAFRDECLELVKGKDDRKRSFRTDKITAMVERRKEMDARRQKFAAILGETLDDLDRDMSLADKALAKFLREASA